uniref:Uncharacterized protein n=1 Tax=viral metagenome TaxID=1070528 RepID=A0A6C0H6A4_9ZZZZ
MIDFSNIFQKLKRVFISEKNSNYILQLILESSVVSFDVQGYRNTLLQLQNIVYDSYIQQICSDLSKRGKLDLEEVLIILNKITINRFQDIITQNERSMSHVDMTQANNSTYANMDTTTNTNANTNTNTDFTTNTTTNTSTDFTTNPIPNTTSTATYTSTDTNTDFTTNPSPHTTHTTTDTTDTNAKLIVLTRTTVHHFFSEDSVLQSGRYTFPFVLNNTKSIEVSHFKLNCNIYNITDANNKFTVTEGTQKMKLTIPIGYYTLDNLCKVMAEVLNHHSVNKHKYQLFRNPVKNRIHFQCNIKDSKPAVFSIHFPEATTRNELGLGDLLGYQKSEYINNNIYVSETNPVDNILEDIYLKLFINGKEIPRITSTKNGFSYFENYSVDLNQHFGTSVTLATNCSSDFHHSFEITEQLNCNELSIELWNNTKHPMTRYSEFECTVTFEHF